MNASSHTFTIPTHSFDTTLIRGRNEREVSVFVTYRPSLDGVEIVSVRGVDSFGPGEWDQLEQEAADDAEDYIPTVRTAWGQY